MPSIMPALHNHRMTVWTMQENLHASNCWIAYETLYIKQCVYVPEGMRGGL